MLTTFNSLNGVLNKIVFQLKKHSPEILIVGGIIGGAVSTVLACVATVKASEVVNEAQEELETIQKTLNNTNSADSFDYTEEDAENDRKKVYLHTAGKMALLYAPAVGIGAASAVSVLGGTGILNKRYAMAAASCAASISEFKEYRKHLIEKFGDEGEQIDRELRHGIKAIEIKEKVTDEDGKTKTVKSKVNVIEETSSCNGYKRVFDCRNPYWDKDTCYNELFLRAKQNYFNDKLIADGHVFLNDVLKDLGFPTTRMGQEVGWIYDPSNDKIDNYIDFGMCVANVIKHEDGNETYDIANAGRRNNVVLLDFNVDGSVLNKVDWPDQV